MFAAVTLLISAIVLHSRSDTPEVLVLLCGLALSFPTGLVTVVGLTYLRDHVSMYVPAINATRSWFIEALLIWAVTTSSGFVQWFIVLPAIFGRRVRHPGAALLSAAYLLACGLIYLYGYAEQVYYEYFLYPHVKPDYIVPAWKYRFSTAVLAVVGVAVIASALMTSWAAMRERRAAPMSTS
jgi:hypothetical protein